MKYENYVKTKIWSTLERNYKNKPIDLLEPKMLDFYVQSVMPYILHYGEQSLNQDEWETKDLVIDNLDGLSDLVLKDYVSYVNLGIYFAHNNWYEIDSLFKQYWVDELSIKVVNDYIEMRKENE